MEQEKHVDQILITDFQGKTQVIDVGSDDWTGLDLKKAFLAKIHLEKLLDNLSLIGPTKFVFDDIKIKDQKISNGSVLRALIREIPINRK